MGKSKVANKRKIILNIILIVILVATMTFLALIGEYGIGSKLPEIETGNDQTASKLIQDKAIIYKAASLTNSYSEDLDLQVALTRGGATLEEGGTVYEGEYIKYNFKITNTTDKEINDVKVVSSIPNEVKYGELVSDFTKFRSNYKYVYDEERREQQKEIGTLKPGESKEFYYEVKVKDLDTKASKNIVTYIKSYIGDNVAKEYEIKNTIKPADTQLFFGGFAEDKGVTYVLQIKSDVETEEEVNIYLPEAFTLYNIATDPNYEIEEMDNVGELNTEFGKKTGERIWSSIEKNKAENKLEVKLSENNVFTATLKTNQRYDFFGMIDKNKIQKGDDVVYGLISTYAETTKKGYMSNELRTGVMFDNVEITMTSDNENQELQYGDNVDYEINIKNVGNSVVEGTKNDLSYININVIDFLPQYVKADNITYDNWEFEYGSGEYKEEGNNVITGMKKKEDITLDISGTRTESGNEKANVDVNLLIPKGESTTIKVKGTAALVYEETKIENTATVTGRNIPTKVSNKIEHTILPIELDGLTDIEQIPSTPPSATPSTSPSTSPSTNPSTDYSNNQQGGTPTTQPTGRPIPAPTAPSTINSNSKDGACDLKIDKYIKKVTVKTLKGTKEYNYDKETYAKAEIRAKELEGAAVTVEYEIEITNVGDGTGIIGQIVDYLPKGFTLVNSSSDWVTGVNDEIINNSKSNIKIASGNSTSVTLTATKQVNANELGTYRNKATVKSEKNISENIDKNESNNIAEAVLTISVSTGDYQIYIIIISAVLVILVLAFIYLCKKRKIKLNNISKIFVLLVVFTMIGFNQISVNALDAPSPLNLTSPGVYYGASDSPTGEWPFWFVDQRWYCFLFTGLA